MTSPGLWSFRSLLPFATAPRERYSPGNRLIAHTPLFGVNNIPIVLHETRPRSHAGERVKINDEGKKLWRFSCLPLMLFTSTNRKKKTWGLHRHETLYIATGATGECFFLVCRRHGGNTSQARRKTSFIVCFILHSCTNLCTINYQIYPTECSKLLSKLCLSCENCLTTVFNRIWYGWFNLFNKLPIEIIKYLVPCGTNKNHIFCKHSDIFLSWIIFF